MVLSVTFFLSLTLSLCHSQFLLKYRIEGALFFSISSEIYLLHGSSLGDKARALQVKQMTNKETYYTSTPEAWAFGLEFHLDQMCNLKYKSHLQQSHHMWTCGVGRKRWKDTMGIEMNDAPIRVWNF